MATVICGLLTLVSFWISYRSFRQKGYLFNNAYLLASKQEREKMDKAPYYRQSAIVFLLIGLMFLMTTIDTLLQSTWLIYLTLAMALGVLLYAIISSVSIEKKKK